MICVYIVLALAAVLSFASCMSGSNWSEDERRED